ncbi:MAG: HAMP domain-containing histidine kinase [Bacteroidetes bacterium]|nr:HAMP domain-containing histidine kinase [Bacteroidota bacterium]
MKRNIFKYLLLLSLSVVIAKATFSKSQADSLFPRTELQFYVFESELADGKYITGDKIGFLKYNYREIPNEWPENNRMITLRSEFIVPSEYTGKNLGLILLPIDYPCKIYLNGKQISIRGNYENGYTNRMHFSETVLLPASNINYAKKNEIAIQLFPLKGEAFPLSRVYVSNRKDANKYVFYRNLFGPKLISALALCGFVFFIFYLIIYFSRREYQKQQFLFFAFMNLFFVISYINNIFTHDFSHTFVLEKVARVGFPMFVFVGICFLLEYTNLFKKKRIIKAALVVFYLPSIIMVLMPNTTAGVIKAYNTYPLISLFIGNIMLFILTLLFFLREKDLRSGFLFMIFMLNIFAGFYDGYYFAVLKTKPYVLLTPNTVFGINLIIFFILAVDHSKLYHLALKSSRKLVKLNQELEDLVEKRTQKTIEYANKLEEANNTKDKFFSIIAHDLKNPFNTLIGYSDILKSDFRDYGQDEISEHLNVIYDTSVNGYNLLENLLKWSQSQTNKLLFEPSKINLYDIVQLCIEDIENQSQFKDIDVINDIPKGLHIVADENLLKTVLRNLINNAVKFTQRNGMVSIGCKKDTDVVEVYVKDTGIGMSKKEKENIFKIDKVSSKPGTEKEKGSGLGLILCKEFVEKHGGTIWVESEPDIGSTFKFTIPKIIHVN